MSTLLLNIVAFIALCENCLLIMNCLTILFWCAAELGSPEDFSAREVFYILLLLFSLLHQLWQVSVITQVYLRNKYNVCVVGASMFLYYYYNKSIIWAIGHPEKCIPPYIYLIGTIVPTDWCIGIIKPMYKKKGSIDDPDNCCDITLLSCIGK